MIENQYSNIKLISIMLTSLVIGMEVNISLKDTRHRHLCNNYSTFIIMLVAIIMFVWINYGDDLLAYIIDRNSNNVTHALISSLLGLLLFRMATIVSLI